MNAFDRAVFFAVNGAAGHSALLDAVGVFFGNDAVFGIAPLFIVVWFALPRPEWRVRSELLYATVAAALALVVNLALTALWYRPRPFVVYPHLVHQLVAHAADGSFPSDHAAVAAAVAASMARAGRGWAWALIAMLVLVMAGRVFIGVHWPTDVLAGGAVGVGAAWAVQRLRRPLWRPLRWVLGLFAFGEAAPRLLPQKER